MNNSELLGAALDIQKQNKDKLKEVLQTVIATKEVAMHRPPLARCLSGHAAVTAKNPLSSSRWSRTCRLNRAWKCMPVRHAPAGLHGAVRPMGAKRVPFRRHVRRKPPWKSSDGGSRE